VKIKDLALNRTANVRGTIIIPPWKAKKVIQLLHHANAEAHLLVMTGEGLTAESMIQWKSATEKRAVEHVRSYLQYGQRPNSIYYGLRRRLALWSAR